LFLSCNRHPTHLTFMTIQKFFIHPYVKTLWNVFSA
jgi:hypothetical protein